jgi:succinoglycan biosynthesis transport protein ExoP
VNYLPPHNDSAGRQLVPRMPTIRNSGISPEWSVSTVRPPGQFLEYFQIIRNNFGWICLLGLIGLAAGCLFASLQRPLYEARTVLDIRSLNENFLTRESSATGTTESVLPEAYIQTEIKILQSDSVRKRALDKLAAPMQQPTPKLETPWWRSMLGFLGPPSLSYADLVSDAGHRVKVRAVGNTRIVEVLCDAQDGQLAASLCNTLAREYTENNMESRVQSTKETSDWLQSQLDDVRKRLTKAENDLKDAGKTTDFGFTSETAESPAQEKLRVLQSELSRIQDERIMKESNYAVALSRDANSLPLDMDAGPIREYRLKLVELKRQLSEMSATMTPQHYRVRELTMQIAEVERALQNERNGLVTRLKSDLDASLRRESMLSAAYDKQSALVSQRDDKAVRYNMIKHDVDSERRLYETLLQKVGEVGLAAAMRTSTITIVDPAVAPLKPYSPNMLASAAVGCFGGSALGLVFALFRVRSDRTLRSPGESPMYLQLRELGVIPSVRGRGFRLRARRSANALSLVSSKAGNAFASRERTGTSLLIPRLSTRSIALATWLRVPEIAEAFFGTMNSLLLAPKDESDWDIQVIVTTSPEVGDGKTTVASNLAIALAQTGRRVVLVDGDLRKPRLHTIFEKAAHNGLAALLDGTEPLKDCPLEKLVSDTHIQNLYLIPTKPVHEGISSKLHSFRMRLLLARLREEFDAVIIDSPPMLNISDARVLGWLADGVLLVFRARKTTKDLALAVQDCLLQDGVRVLGSVLNDFNPRKGDRYNTYSSYFRVA